MHKKLCYWFIFKRGHYLWSKYRFKLSPPNENATALFSVIVPKKIYKNKKEWQSNYLDLYIKEKVSWREVSDLWDRRSQWCERITQGWIGVCSLQTSMFKTPKSSYLKYQQQIVQSTLSGNCTVFFGFKIKNLLRLFRNSWNEQSQHVTW